MTDNYRAVLEYDGTEYAGFQVQVAQKTIQGQVEAALKQITGAGVCIAGAGRTDAGVHARGQVISFRCEWRHEVAELQRALNAVLPGDIVIRFLEITDDSFHARFSAIRRTYFYSIYQDPIRSPLAERYAMHIERKLDVTAMQLAADNLCGKHDFAAFGLDPRGAESTVRWVYCARWHTGDNVQAPQVAWNSVSLQFEVTADAFLRGMVRRIVGSLVLVGLKKISVQHFVKVLESRSLACSAPPAPARGLSLWHVQYEDEGGLVSGPFDERRSR
ncbi:MAG: tRNA pseudouridine(38-40) synthase TruA [Anaerolineae bacterium]